MTWNIKLNAYISIVIQPVDTKYYVSLVVSKTVVNTDKTSSVKTRVLGGRRGLETYDVSVPLDEILLRFLNSRMYVIQNYTQMRENSQ